MKTKLANIFGRGRAVSSILEQVASAIEQCAAASVELPSDLMAIFWSLSLYELNVPAEAYDREIQRLQTSVDEHTESHVEALQIERQHQEQVFESCKDFFARTSASLFRQSDTQAKAFVQHCLLPRCLQSPNDALYCAAFLERLHQSSPTTVPLCQLSTILLGDPLASVIFTCTELEASNLGRFLARWLVYLGTLGELTETDWTRTPVRKPFTDLAAVELLSQAQYTEIWYSWHRSLWRATKTCYDSRDYMHTRNCLLVLEKISKCFPRFTWMGKNIAASNAKVASMETREDLKIRALGYSAMLKRLEPTWIEPLQKSTQPAIPTAPTNDNENTDMDRDLIDLPVPALTPEARTGSPNGQARSQEATTVDDDHPADPVQRQELTKSEPRHDADHERRNGVRSERRSKKDNKPQASHGSKQSTPSSPRQASPRESRHQDRSDPQVKNPEMRHRERERQGRGARTGTRPASPSLSVSKPPAANDENYGRLRREDSQRAGRNMSEEMRGQNRSARRAHGSASDASSRNTRGDNGPANPAARPPTEDWRRARSPARPPKRPMETPNGVTRSSTDVRLREPEHERRPPRSPTSRREQAPTEPKSQDLPRGPSGRSTGPPNIPPSNASPSGGRASRPAALTWDADGRERERRETGADNSASGTTRPSEPRSVAQDRARRSSPHARTARASTGRAEQGQRAPETMLETRDRDRVRDRDRDRPLHPDLDRGRTGPAIRNAGRDHQAETPRRDRGPPAAPRNRLVAATVSRPSRTRASDANEARVKRARR